MEKLNSYTPTYLRITLALLFIFIGINKLMDPTGITGMLTGLGFPLASFFAWVLLLSEIIFGLALLVGWKIRIAVWPLFFILLVATLLIHIKAAFADFSNVPIVMNLLWHLIGMSGLMLLRETGPGKLSMK